MRNTLSPSTSTPAAGSGLADDIRVGEIHIERGAVREALNGGSVEIDVIDSDSSQPLPCRLTIVDSQGSLHMTGASSNDELAVRPGVIYAARGQAKFGLPPGRYTIFAGHGFEFSLAKTEVTVTTGETFKQRLSIRREVPTSGYVACDTHIHTLTHSGHGDATIAERLITLTAEGIELPIATDHNIHVDYDSIARQLKLRQHFTPVIGNEVTTTVGHFNVFPVRSGARVPNHKLQDWGKIFDEIYDTPDVKVAVLNHARDLHSGTRPFGPDHHNAATGDNLDGWPMRFNAMEVINSSATQTDMLQLFRDWLTLLNRGYSITPVGGSDSHDVARHFVGQGRTYIRCDDSDPGQIDVTSAVDSFVNGRVLVSYGLIAELTLDGRYGSGDLAPVSNDTVSVAVRVLGPHWVEASRVQLFANGQLIREQELDKEKEGVRGGVKWQGRWTLPRPRHDVHLVALAVGRGIDAPYWKTVKPYQPISPDWEPHTMGCSGALWLDADGDGQRTAARLYAERLCAAANNDVAKVVERLSDYDPAVATQTAHMLRMAGASLESEEYQAALKNSPPQVQLGFRAYLDASHDNEVARSATRP